MDKLDQKRRSLLINRRRKEIHADPRAIAAAMEQNSPYVSPKSQVVLKRARNIQRKKSILNWYNGMSLKTAFVLYVAFFLLAAILFSTLILSALDHLHADLLSRYDSAAPADFFRDYASSNGTITYYNYQTEEYYYIDMMQEDTLTSILLTTLQMTIPLLLFVLLIILAGIQFYKNRLQPPIAILEDASGKISAQDLSFSVAYDRNDEMGRLCDSFERMRAILLGNFNDMWRQMEDRKRLNSAFSHDLRTPLTVLKGNLYMLEESLSAEDMRDESVQASLLAMQNHIVRLENYVDMMSRLQKIEDIAIDRRPIDRREFIDLLRNTAFILCENKTLQFFDETSGDTLRIDPEIVMQIIENLLSNACRFAKKRVSVVVTQIEGNFVLSVADDGKGFSKEDLKQATNPFYKEKSNVYDNHFGLGLNIVKIFAERHGGGVTLMNVRTGGGLVRVHLKEY